MKVKLKNVNNEYGALVPSKVTVESGIAKFVVDETNTVIDIDVVSVSHDGAESPVSLTKEQMKSLQSYLDGMVSTNTISAVSSITFILPVVDSKTPRLTPSHRFYMND